MVQWLELHTSTAGGMGSIPDWGPEILQATVSQKKKKKNHSREVLKLEETMKDNGADTTDLQVRDLGCTEGLRQQQGWKGSSRGRRQSSQPSFCPASPQIQGLPDPAALYTWTLETVKGKTWSRRFQALSAKESCSYSHDF